MSCSRPGCSIDASWQPVLVAGSGANTVRARLVHVGFCDAHREETKLDDLLSPEGFVKLAKHVRERGRKAPAGKTARLEWKRVGPAELEELAVKTDPVGKSEDLAF